MKNTNGTYSLGPRLLLHYPRYPVEADQLNNATFKVDANGLVYLTLVYTWRFVHLNDFFKEVVQWSGTPSPEPVSYTHLTLPTNREV